MSSDRRAELSDVVRPRNVGAPIKRTEDPRLLTGRAPVLANHLDGTDDVVVQLFQILGR